MPISKLAVIIPFFQARSGILIRALQSIIEQDVPKGWIVEVVVVDDGSPIGVADEVDGLILGKAIELKVVRQPNGGVAAARNRGLDEISSDVSIISFLDSDDIWASHHVGRMIKELSSGKNFYFTDNRRLGFHDSYIANSAYELRNFLKSAPVYDGMVSISPDAMIKFIVNEFPAQISTIGYTRSMAPDIRFDTRMSSAGEDLLFLVKLVSLSESVLFDTQNCVECGDGLNMYFGQLRWDSPKFLYIKVDEVICHKTIEKIKSLSAENRRVNISRLRHHQRELGLHIVRNLTLTPGRLVGPIKRLIAIYPLLSISIPYYTLRGVFAILYRALKGAAPA